MASNRSNNKTKVHATLETTSEGRQVNREWNAKGFNRRVKTPAAPIKAHRQPAHVVARCLPETSSVTVRNAHTFHGGRCQGCGAMLGYWFHYKICDPCLSGVTKRKARAL